MRNHLPPHTVLCLATLVALASLTGCSSNIGEPVPFEEPLLRLRLLTPAGDRAVGVAQYPSLQEAIVSIAPDGTVATELRAPLVGGVARLLLDADGAGFALLNNGEVWSRTEDGRWSAVPHPPGPRYGDGQPSALASNGELWIETDDTAIHRFDGRAWVEVDVDGWLHAGRPGALIETNDGVYEVGGDGELAPTRLTRNDLAPAPIRVGSHFLAFESVPVEGWESQRRRRVVWVDAETGDRSSEVRLESDWRREGRSVLGPDGHVYILAEKTECTRSAGWFSCVRERTERALFVLPPQATRAELVSHLPLDTDAVVFAGEQLFAHHEDEASGEGRLSPVWLDTSH